MLKILQARLQQYVNHQLPDVQAGFRKAEEREIKLGTSAESWKKQESSRKTPTSSLLTMLKPLCGSQQAVENSSRDGNTRPPYLPPKKSVYRSISNSYNLSWKNKLVPNQEMNTSRLYVITLLS